MRNISINSFIPKTIRGKIILCSLVIYFVAEILHDFLPPLDPVDSSKTEWIIEYMVRLFRDASLSIGLATMIIGGLRAIRAEGFTLKKIIMPTLGGLVCVYLTVVAWQAHNKMEEVVTKLKSDQIYVQKLENKLPELVTDPRANSEKIYWLAKMRFGLDGKRIEYPNEHGKIVIYEPTEKERVHFEQMEKTKYLLKQADISLERATYLWISILVVGTIIGIVLPVKKDEKTVYQVNSGDRKKRGGATAA